MKTLALAINTDTLDTTMHYFSQCFFGSCHPINNLKADVHQMQYEPNARNRQTLDLFFVGYSLSLPLLSLDPDLKTGQVDVAARVLRHHKKKQRLLYFTMHLTNAYHRVCIGDHVAVTT